MRHRGHIPKDKIQQQKGTEVGGVNKREGKAFDPFHGPVRSVKHIELPVELAAERRLGLGMGRGSGISVVKVGEVPGQFAEAVQDHEGGISGSRDGREAGCFVVPRGISIAVVALHQDPSGVFVGEESADVEATFFAKGFVVPSGSFVGSEEVFDGDGEDRQPFGVFAEEGQGFFVVGLCGC